MARFYVLNEFDESGTLLKTEFSQAPPWNRGEELYCPVCNETVSLLHWLPK